MAGPEAYGLCTYKITEKTSCQTLEKDVTGDTYPESLAVCDSAKIEWNGDGFRCMKQFLDVFAGVDGNFTGTNGSFTKPLAQIERLGAAPSICGDEFVKARKRLGITLLREKSDKPEECFVKPYGPQKWLLSYPVQKDKGLIIEELRNARMKKFVHFKVGGKDMGIGTAGEFKLKDGSTITGVVVQIGFVNLGQYRKDLEVPPVASMGPQEYPDVQFPAKNFNIYIYTARSKASNKMGRVVDLSEIREILPMSDEEFKKLALKFREDRLSISEILKELEKLSPQTEGPIDL